MAGKTTTLVGGADLNDTWARLMRKAATPRTTAQTLAPGAERIRDSAAQMASRSDEAPHIADNIVVTEADRQGDEQAAIAIGPRRGFAYGSALELGTIDTAAQPFMRPALDADRDGAIAEAGAELWKQIVSEVSK